MENTVAQRTLKNKKGVGEKLGYLWFAYQGAIIATILTILFVGGLVFSVVTKKEPVLSVRVLSKDVSYEQVVGALEKDYSQQLTLSKKETVDVKNLDLGDTDNQDVLVAQLAAKEIDVLFLTEEMDKEMQPLFDKNGIKQGSLHVDHEGIKLVSRVPSQIPHQKNLEMIQGQTIQ